MYVRLCGPLWSHSLFGFESYNGHITSMIHSKHRVSEQLSFNQTMGYLADRLVQTESERTLNFTGPLSNLKKVVLPGIYSMENFTQVILLMRKLVPFAK